MVSEVVLKKAIAFLDLAAGGSRKYAYGYADNTDARPGTALTAVGLLCRYSIDRWGPVHPGMGEGVMGLLQNGPRAGKPLTDLYYFYYATQVVHNFDGDAWKDWNLGKKTQDGTRKDGMRDWLIDLQVRKDGPNQGSSTY